MTEPTRQPAHDHGAEQAALGAMMLSREALLEVAEIVTAGSFYRPNHGAIFTTVLDLDMRGEPADAFTVAAALADSGALARIGGVGYLHDLIAAVPTAANGAHYARIVAARALSRELDKVALRISHLATSGQDPKAALESAMQMLTDLEAATATTAGGPRMWSEIAPRVLDEIDQAGKRGDETPGLPSGFIDLDKLTNGFHPGQLITIGARPGVGKSLLLAGFVQHATWKRKLPAVLFSLEMTELEIGKRLLAADSRVPLNLLMSGQVGENDWARLNYSTANSLNAPLAIDETPDLTIADIRARATKLHRQFGGLSLIAVDYLQLVSTPRGENRQVAVSAISRGLKLLAKQLGVPVVVAAQLNRESAGRGDKRPQLTDLRESGSIEQDSDVVILIHRDDYHDPESSRAGEADLIVEKNRGGPRDTVTVAAQLHVSRFVDMAIV
jgi:replicative DNA helicase